MSTTYASRAHKQQTTVISQGGNHELAPNTHAKPESYSRSQQTNMVGNYSRVPVDKGGNQTDGYIKTRTARSGMVNPTQYASAGRTEAFIVNDPSRPDSLGVVIVGAVRQGNKYVTGAQQYAIDKPAAGDKPAVTSGSFRPWSQMKDMRMMVPEGGYIKAVDLSMANYVDEHHPDADLLRGQAEQDLTPAQRQEMDAVAFALGAVEAASNEHFPAMHLSREVIHDIV